MEYENPPPKVHPSLRSIQEKRATRLLAANLNRGAEYCRNCGSVLSDHELDQQFVDCIRCQVA